MRFNSDCSRMIIIQMRLTLKHGDEQQQQRQQKHERQRTKKIEKYVNPSCSVHVLFLFNSFPPFDLISWPCSFFPFAPSLLVRLRQNGNG